MSATHLDAEEVSTILVYDWLLCLDEEVRFMWNGRSGVTVSWLVYGLSRYALLIQNLLGLATIYPMSDLLYGKCMGPDGHQYTGHGRVSSLLCPACIRTVEQEQMVGGHNHPFDATAIGDAHRECFRASLLLLIGNPFPGKLQCFYEAPTNLPSPFNCSTSSSLSPALVISVNVVKRASQFAAELLVVGITWWYTYQSYRIRKGVNLGKTISSLLFYNGSIYFLFIAILYMFEVIILTASVPGAVYDAMEFMQVFYDPIAAILICRFMLSLRQFDSTIASSRYSGPGSRVREHTAFGDVLQFAAQPSDTLPSFIASFAHPIHVDSYLSDEDPDATVEEGSEGPGMDVVVPTRTAPSQSGR
ncbi:hypothetical protein LXA43DRAFT_1109322 [Ganoderma leucocontextum]|nr:hypothetical protein LXA43DRAFT_1109322 [Ganoderma leucocontextum]